MVSLTIPGIGPTVEQRVAAIDTEILEPVVRAVLDDETATVEEWNRTQMPGGSGGGYFGTALFRFDGTATTRSATREWSVVLKILAERPGEKPSEHPYWKREVEAYRSNLLADIDVDFTQTTVYRIEEHPGESVWLWMEDLEDEYGDEWPHSREWPLEQYRRAATHLGQFNGAFLTELEIPSEPWLIERQFDLDRTAGAIALVDRVPEDPTVRHLFPTEDDRDRLFTAWRNRDRFLAARKDLPETFCHFDAFGRNLFATKTEKGRYQTVAIDWDQCGIGRIGDDAGALVFLTLLFLDWPIDRAETLENAVLDGYRDGLAAAGWNGQDDVVLQGYRLHVVNRWLEWIGNAVRGLIDERKHDWFVEISGSSIDEIFERDRDLNRFAFDTINKLDIEATDSHRNGTVP